MSPLRVVPCTRERIPEVVQILTGAGDGEPDARLCAEVEAVYLDHPWAGLGLPSLVCEDAAGRAQGFLGVIPRPMLLDGRPILAAVCSNLRVRVGPHGRREPTAGLRLLHALLAGPQDLTFADQANDRSKRLWEGCGGIAAPLYSLDWILPLRPSGPLLALEAARVRLPRPGLLRLLGRIGDRLGAGPLRRLLLDQPDGSRVVPLSPDQALASVNGTTTAAAAGGGARLRASYDPASLAWLTAMAERKALPGTFRNRAVVAAVAPGREERPVGWFTHLQRRPGVADVLHLHAARGRMGQVLGAMIRDALHAGIGFLRGAVDVRHLQAYRDHLCLLSAGRWTLVHARNPVLLDLFRRGEALQHGYDGERWIIEFPESL